MTKKRMKTNTYKNKVLKENLLRLIRHLSRYQACRLGDRGFASRLRVGERTIQAALKRLAEEGRIEIVTGDPKRIGNGGFAIQRTIYLVAQDRSAEQGALMLYALLLDRGLTCASLTDGHLCGQLRCTPDQLRAYEDFAFQQKWLRRGAIQEGNNKGRWGYICTPPSEQVERVAPPGRWFTNRNRLSDISDAEPVLLNPATPKELDKEKLVAIAKGFDEQGQPCTLTIPELAVQAGYSQSWAKVLRAELIKEGHLHIVPGPQGRDALTTVPPSFAEVPQEPVGEPQSSSCEERKPEAVSVAA